MAVVILEKKAVRDIAMPITVEQYQSLGAAGLIRERTELIAGIIVEKMPKPPNHIVVVRRLVKFFVDNLPPNFDVRKEGLELSFAGIF